jgi:hypothetical protein
LLFGRPKKERDKKRIAGKSLRRLLTRRSCPGPNSQNGIALSAVRLAKVKPTSSKAMDTYGTAPAFKNKVEGLSQSSASIAINPVTDLSISLGVET